MTVPGSANPLLLRSAAPTAYQVSRSLRFNGSVDNSYLSRTPGSAGNRKTWTFSCWVKRSSLGARQVIFGTGDASFNNANWIEFFSTDALRIGDYTTATQYDVITTQVFRDVSAWGHLVVAVDTTQATASNRVRAYWNGSEITAFSTATYPTQNLDTQLNTTTAHGIGRGGTYNAQYFNGYLAECHFVNGLQLTPSSFGETDTNGEWQPKLYSGSYNTNGFKLTFADNSNTTAATLGADTSGNGNNYTPTNFSVTAGAGNDSLTDTPTSYGTGTSGGDVRGNFCTANPLATTTSLTLSNGNLQVVGGLVGGATYRGNSTIGVASGKWYFETTFVSVGDNTAVGIGQSNIIDQYPGQDALSYAYVFEPAVRINSNSQVSYGSALTAGDVFMCAFDLDNNKIFFGKNGTWFGSSVPASGTNPAYTLSAGTYTPIFRPQKNSGTCEIQFNFGQRAFAYTPPANFKPLVDTYLPTPTVAKPSEVMDVKLYTGNGSTQTISGLGFSPDFVWIKARSSAIGSAVTDAVRGASQRLFTETTDAEDSVATLTSFNSDGFGVSTASGLSTRTNGNAVTYAAWCWDAGSSAAAINNSGSISSTVKVNTASGFSVVTYTVGNNTSQTIGHGLGVAPQLIIVKERNQANNWQVYHASLGNGSFLYLNATNASGSNNLWNNTSPTSTVFSIRSGGSANFYDGKDQVAYCFAPVAGYSSAFSYTGNGSSDGPMVYLGFRPKFILQKRTDAAGSWLLLDTSRDPYNAAKNELFANSSIAEYTNTDEVDFLSNGFKVRCTFANLNASGGSFIGYAFAENPFQYARAR